MSHASKKDIKKKKAQLGRHQKLSDIDSVSDSRRVRPHGRTDGLTSAVVEGTSAAGLRGRRPRIVHSSKESDTDGERKDIKDKGNDKEGEEEEEGTDTTVDSAFLFELEDHHFTAVRGRSGASSSQRIDGAPLMCSAFVILFIIMFIAGHFGIRHGYYDVNNVALKRARFNSTLKMGSMNRDISIRENPKYPFEFLEDAGFVVRSYKREKDGSLEISFRSPVPALCLEFSSDEFSASDIIASYTSCHQYIQELPLPAWVDHIYFSGAVIPCQDYNASWPAEQQTAWREEFVASQSVVAELRKHLWGVYAAVWSREKAGDAIEITESRCVSHPRSLIQYIRLKVQHSTDIQVSVQPAERGNPRRTTLQIIYDPIRMISPRTQETTLLLPIYTQTVASVWVSCEDAGVCTGPVEEDG